MKTAAKKRKEIYEKLWQKEYKANHLKEIDALARKLGIMIPHKYLCYFHANDQETVLRLLLEAGCYQYLLL